MCQFKDLEKLDDGYPATAPATTVAAATSAAVKAVKGEGRPPAAGVHEAEKTLKKTGAAMLQEQRAAGLA